jgi:hypothetical protein
MTLDTPMGLVVVGGIRGLGGVWGVLCNPYASTQFRHWWMGWRHHSRHFPKVLLLPKVFHARGVLS